MILHTIYAGEIELPNGSKILDVGCGQSPVPEATMLVDKYLTYDGERLGPLCTLGKPFVLADMHYLPFVDKCFDFIVAQGVVEHADDPTLVCSEFSRVAKAGVMTLPTQLNERVSSWDFHKWFCIVRGDTLYFVEKPRYFFPMLMEGAFLEFYHTHPKEFILVFRWEGTIKNRVIKFATDDDYTAFRKLGVS